MLYIHLQVLYNVCSPMVMYMSQKGLRQAGRVFRCLSGLSCCILFTNGRGGGGHAWFQRGDYAAP